MTPVDPIAVALIVMRALDSLGIIRVQGEGLDEEYLRTHAPVMGVADLLARALSEGRR